MRRLFKLRPIQVIDVSFLLCKKTFTRFFLISIAIVLPLQIVAWIFEVSAADNTNEFSGRTLLIAAMVQCFIVGFTLVLTSNIFGSRVSKEYTKEYLGKEYETSFNSTRLKTLFFQISIQVVCLALCPGTRYSLGRITTDNVANILSWFLLIGFVAVWAAITLRRSFIIPISINEQATGKHLKKRLKQVNSESYFSLYGTYCYCWLLAIVLVSPILTALNFVISKDFINSDIGELAFTNLIFGLVISFISVIYSYILIINYFNGRIGHEGFDIAVTINEIELQRRERGKLLNVDSR